jgi:hypothetical protein
MGGSESTIVSGICGAITIIEELIEVRAKMKNQDASAMDDLLKLMKNYDKYSKKEKKMIRKTMEIFLQQNISMNGSQVSLEERTPFEPLRQEEKKSE